MADTYAWYAYKKSMYSWEWDYGNAMPYFQSLSSHSGPMSDINVDWTSML